MYHENTKYKKEFMALLITKIQSLRQRVLPEIKKGISHESKGKSSRR